MQGFKELGIDERILEILEAKKFKSPFKIQSRTLPLIQKGYDILAQSATGSGKTLCFAVPALQKSKEGKGIQSLILTPTKELCKQLSTTIKELGVHFPIHIATLYGGQGMQKELEILQNTEIVIATPGRLTDHIEKGHLDFSSLKILVLDEADTLIKQEFLPALEYILRLLPKTRQNLFFSATIPEKVQDLSRKYAKDPRRILGEKSFENKKLQQYYFEVEHAQKLSLLAYLLNTQKAGLSLVFANRQDVVEFIGKNLKTNTDLKCVMLHAGLSRGKRNKILEDFREQKCDVLITTDIGARGLDIEGITHIYNYTLPKEHEKYIHRIGRTARAGRGGTVFNFITSKDLAMFTELFKKHNTVLIRREIPSTLKEISIKKEYKKKTPKRG